MLGTLLTISTYSLLPTYACKAGFTKFKRKINDSNKEIALTFDDGPNEKYTTSVLNILKQHNIKATFFIVAKYAYENPIGLHSLEHKNTLFRSYKYVKYDFEQSMKIMNENNWKLDCYRTPWGQVIIFTLYYMKKNNLCLVLLDVMVGNWRINTTKDEISSAVFE